MQIATVLLALGGSKDNTVSKYGVTAAEVAVLRQIHGDDAVTDVQPTGEIKRTSREERARLVEVYGRRGDNGRHSAPAVEALFPGAAARVFETFEELELPTDFYKAATRVSASSPKAAAATVPKVDEEDPAEKFKKMKLAQLREYAVANEIDLGDAKKEKDVRAAILKAEEEKAAAAADEGDDDDGIDDIDDNNGRIFE